MTATIYATVPDLRLVLDGTDAGTGMAAQLSDNQLTLALTAASTRITTYTGTDWNSSTPQATPPDLLHDLCLDMAAWWATTYYMKNKDLGNQHPVVLRYMEAKQVLADLRDGKIRPDVKAPGDPGAEAGNVINLIPNIFSPADSNTRFDPATNGLLADTPPDISTGSRWDDLNNWPEW
jgi:Protein of unknown function (DUF1320)